MANIWSDLSIFVADAGSVARENYHWVSSNDESRSSTDPDALASSVVEEVARGRIVALGYECPLFVPLMDDASLLGKARDGEVDKAFNSRAFNAGAGASVFATGIQSLAWVLSRIRMLQDNITATTRWSEFKHRKHPLFLWEAFVSGSEKAFPASHLGDAVLAMLGFRQSLNLEFPSRITCSKAFSLGGAALIRARLSDDLTLLDEPCIVIRPVFSEEESAVRLKAYNQRQLDKRIANSKRKVT